MSKELKIYDLKKIPSTRRDNLTGLYNHSFFQEALQLKISNLSKNSNAFGVALIDLDSFSIYNRSLGSIKGNEALKTVTGIIQSSIADSHLCARFGGDVFAIIFEDSSIKDSVKTLEKIRLQVEDKFKGKITLSAGFASSPSEGTNHVELMNNVQHSLHHAKISGKNCVQYLEQNVSDKPDKKPTILLVDDSPLSIKMIKKVLSLLDYRIISAESGDEALEIVKKTDVDLILLDIIMPGKDGYEVCRMLKNQNKTSTIPVIMVTSLNDSISKEKSLQAGADDFVTKPFDKPEIIARTSNLIKLRKLNKKLSAAENTVMSLASLVDGRDITSKGNIPEMAKLSEEIASRLGLKENIVDAVRVAGILHDIGKIGIPEKVLNKKKPLNRQEWEIIRRHPDLSYNASLPLKNIYPDSLNAIRYHHERLDGSGYPKALKKKEIPITARIVAVVDMYDALTSERPYRKAKSKEEALILLQKEAEKGKIDKKVLNSLKSIIQKKANNK